MPHSARVGRLPITSVQFCVGEREPAAGLAELGGDLRAQQVVADAHRSTTAASLPHGGLDPLGEASGAVVVGDRGADERLVPAHHLDDHVGKPRSTSMTRADASS